MPLAGPAIAASFGLVFLLNLMDYSVTASLGINVYSLDLFAEYSATRSVVRPLMMSLPLMAVGMLVVAACQWPLRNAAVTRIPHRSPGGGPMRWPRWFLVARWTAFAIIAVSVLVMSVALVMEAGSVTELGRSLSAMSNSAGFSLMTSLAAAIFCLPLATIAAVGMAQPGRGGLAWQLLTTAPLAIPAPLIGVGLISLLTAPGTPAVYPTPWMPAWAGIARFTPFAAFIILAQIRRLDPALLDAARMLHTRPLRTWSQVLWPMLAPGLLAAAAVVFALTTGELGATMIVAPAGHATVTMRIYNFLHYGGLGQVAGMCLVMASIAALLGALAIFAMGRWQRLVPDDDR